jgi:LysM repeat protein
MWQTPKTDWSERDYFNIGDYNRIKGNAEQAQVDPWEDSIYSEDLDYSDRVTKTLKAKRSNQVFLTVLVVLIVLVAAVPVGFYFYAMNGGGKNDPSVVAKSGSSSSKAATSTSLKSTSVDSSAFDSKSTTSSSSSASSSTTSSTSSTTTSSSTKESTYTIKAGDNLSKIAAANGMTIDELVSLNGIDTANYMLMPGDTLKVK